MMEMTTYRGGGVPGFALPLDTYCGVPGLPCLSKSFDSYIDLRVSAPCLVVARRGLVGFDGDPAPLARDNILSRPTSGALVV